MFHYNFGRSTLQQGTWIVKTIMNHTNPEQRRNDAVIARVVEVNRREQIDLDVNDSQTKQNTDRAGYQGTVCDSQVLIKALFSDEALKTDEDDESCSQTESELSSLPGMNIILKKYSIIVNQVMRENSWEFMLLVEKFTLWGQGGHFYSDVKDCNELPQVRRMMSLLHGDVSGNKVSQEESEGPSSENVDNSMQSESQVHLTQLVEEAGVEVSQEEEEVEEDVITERDMTHLLIPPCQQSELAQVVHDISHLLIPEEQAKQLEDMEDWKPDYVPPSSEKSSEGSYFEQAMGRDCPLQGTSPPDFYLKRDLSPSHSPHETDSDPMGDLYLNNPLDNQPSLQLSTEEDSDDKHTQQEEQIDLDNCARNSRKRKLDSPQMRPPSRKTRTSTDAPNTLEQSAAKKPLFKGSTKEAPTFQKSRDLPTTLPTTQESHQLCKAHKPVPSSSNETPEKDSVYPSKQALRQAILNLKYPTRQLKALINIYAKHQQSDTEG
ncbi:uncharacterized protein LOC144880702 isoform X2 [Branchiostoma floridae x Branchiostoma japonicum]